MFFLSWLRADGELASTCVQCALSLHVALKTPALQTWVALLASYDYVLPGPGSSHA